MSSTATQPATVTYSVEYSRLDHDYACTIHFEDGRDEPIGSTKTQAEGVARCREYLWHYYNDNHTPETAAQIAATVFDPAQLDASAPAWEAAPIQAARIRPIAPEVSIAPWYGPIAPQANPEICPEPAPNEPSTSATEPSEPAPLPPFPFKTGQRIRNTTTDQTGVILGWAVQEWKTLDGAFSRYYMGIRGTGIRDSERDCVYSSTLDGWVACDEPALAPIAPSQDVAIAALRKALKSVIYICERRERPSSETYRTLIEIAQDALACPSTKVNWSEDKPSAAPTAVPAATHDEYEAFVAADAAWSAELEHLFGRRAGDVRYTVEGRTGPTLAPLHAEFCRADAAWHNTRPHTDQTLCHHCLGGHPTWRCPAIGGLLMRPTGRSPQALIAAIIPTIAYDSGTLDEAWHRADQIANEARTLERLLLALLLKINSALYPVLYQRVNRLHEAALQRAKRREVAASVAMYRHIGGTPKPDHPHYDAIMAALSHPCPSCGDATVEPDQCQACVEVREVAVSEEQFYFEAELAGVQVA